MTDEQIALAMEFKHGLGLRWKSVARLMKIELVYLQNQIAKAKRRGMRT